MFGISLAPPKPSPPPPPNNANQVSPDEIAHFLVHNEVPNTTFVARVQNKATTIAGNPADYMPAFRPFIEAEHQRAGKQMLAGFSGLLLSALLWTMVIMSLGPHMNLGQQLAYKAVTVLVSAWFAHKGITGREQYEASQHNHLVPYGTVDHIQVGPMVVSVTLEPNDPEAHQRLCQQSANLLLALTRHRINQQQAKNKPAPPPTA
ncbi:MAG: hypothetical protein KC475_03810 [Cyanobacteria bacterium HKST-UBA03]|nr:hypothetical protein [Cyanobacteria bacterium HKST-UBA03]